MPFKKYMKSQLKKSLVTGIPQIVQVNGIVRKVIKSIVFVVCVSACLYQIIGFMEVYYQYPIVVDVFVHTPAEVRQPAYSVCPHNSIITSVYCWQFENHCTNKLEVFNEFCRDNWNKEICKPEDKLDGSRYDEDNIPIIIPDQIEQYPDIDAEKLKRIYYNSDMLDKSTFLDEQGVKDHFGMVVPMEEFYTFTDMGLPVKCLAIGVMWNNETGVVENITLDRVYEAIFTVDEREVFYNLIPHAIQVAVHDPLEKVNPFVVGFTLTACKSYKIYLQKVEKFLLPPPYPTMCEDYIQNWKAKGGNGPISQRQCVENCMLNKSIEQFGCYNPKDISMPNTFPFCKNEKYILNAEEEKICRAKCPSPCWQISFDTRVVEGVAIDQAEHADQCPTRIEIHLSRMDVMTFSYQQKYNSVEIFGYVGGYLGMWLGFSLIAAFDLLELVVNAIIYACKSSKEKKKKRPNKTTTTHVTYYSSPKQMFM